jgi:hypothetical protein
MDGESVYFTVGCIMARHSLYVKSYVEKQLLIFPPSHRWF